MTSNDLPPMSGVPSDDVSGDADHDAHDRLNRYLDGLVGDLDAGDPGIDVSLTATVRAVHALAALDERETPTEGERARSWQRLVQLSGIGATPEPGATAGTRIDIVRGVQPMHGLTTVGGSTRLIATIAAVLVLVVSALSLYQRVPGGGSTPTVSAAGYGASPMGAESTVPASPIVTTTVTSTGSIGPAPETCDEHAAAYDDVTGTVVVLGEGDQRGRPAMESSPSNRRGVGATPWVDCTRGIR